MRGWTPLHSSHEWTILVDQKTFLQIMLKHKRFYRIFPRKSSLLACFCGCDAMSSDELRANRSEKVGGVK
eukprot:scaffold1639_cov236-Chaetoceros_neogracile.AAC.2